MKPKVLYPAHMRKEPKKSQMTYTLGLLAFVSLSLAFYTVSSLGWEERVPVRKGSFLFLLGFIFYTSLYYFINCYALGTKTGQRIVKKFKLTTADIFDISNKAVSAIQALFCIVSGAAISLYSCPRNLLRTNSYISESYAWFGAAYFFYDIWSMYKVHCSMIACSQQNGDSKKKDTDVGNFIEYVWYNPIIVGHHLFIGGFGFCLITHLRGDLGDCVFGFVYAMEFSTPFVSFRSILARFGMKNTKVYLINGLFMLGTFFVFRILMFPYVMYLYASYIGKSYYEAISNLPRGCKISISILILPQIYWFCLMLRGAKKVMRMNSTSVVDHKKKQITVNSH